MESGRLKGGRLIEVLLYILVDCSQYNFPKLISILIGAIKQKSSHNIEHNALFIWRRFDISRSVFKGFIRITFVVMAPSEK